MRTVLLALAALAVYGVMVAGASAAEPAFFECARLNGGGFADKLCSEGAKPGKGKYELQEDLATHEFSGKIGELAINNESFEMTCSKSLVSGQITGAATLEHVKLTLNNCTGQAPECGVTVNHHVGIVEVGPLSGTIGYIAKGLHSVGVQLRPEVGTTLAEFRCGGVGPPEYRLKGAIFAGLSGNINALSKTFAISSSATGSLEGGEPTVFEVEKLSGSETGLATLSGGPWRIKTKAEIEVKA